MARALLAGLIALLLAPTARAATVVERSDYPLGLAQVVDRPAAGEFAAIVVPTFTYREPRTLLRLDRDGNLVAPPVPLGVDIPANNTLQDFAVQYNPRRDELLVVYSSWSGTYAPSLLAQRFSGEGGRIGRPFRVTAPNRPAPQPQGVVLAYDTTSGGYLLVWETPSRRAQYEYDVHARRLASDGRPAGRPSTPLPTSASGVPRVAYDPRARRFLISWTHRHGYARPLQPDGSPAGRTERLGVYGSGQLAFDPRIDRFLSLEQHAGGVVVRRLRDSGAPSGSSTIWTARFGPDSTPVGSVVVGPRGSETLLTWADLDDREHAGRYYAVHARRFDASARHPLSPPLDIGSLAPPPPPQMQHGADTQASEMQPDGTAIAAYSPSARRYLLVWPGKHPSTAPGSFGPTFDSFGIETQTLPPGR